MASLVIQEKSYDPLHQDPPPQHRVASVRRPCGGATGSSVTQAETGPNIPFTRKAGADDGQLSTKDKTYVQSAPVV